METTNLEIFGGETNPTTTTARLGDGSQTGSIINNILGGILNPVKDLASTTTTTTTEKPPAPKDNTTGILLVVGAVVILAVVGFIMFRK